MLYNLVLDAVAKAAIHSKGSTEEGEEVLLFLFFYFLFFLCESALTVH